MPSPPRILALAGSTRSKSYNKALARVAAHAAEAAGATVTLIDLRDYPLPLYDEDLERAEGLPEAAKRLREVFFAHDGLILASPEYNGGYSAVLKNTIDWLSRRQGDEGPLKAFAGKTVLLLAASPGALGGIRVLAQLRALLGGIQMIVLPEQKAIPKANEVFDQEGNMTDEAIRKSIEGLVKRLVDVTARLKD
ncbi:MAG: NAD(P)H-dependent oxidoreductase [Candidatus Hydrogenedentes bacterium]|nr:NAD(P)H-dependent oxidoreductase [Candidatus Hydrogenedentota bacterium]